MPFMIESMLINLNALFLSFFILFFTPLMASESIESDNQAGLQTARVIVPHCIVYSDESMSTPLGYISMGKLITVGNRRNKNPKLVSTVVSGRLVFIESKNIHFENEAIELLNSKQDALPQHNIDILINKPEEKFNENNSVYFSLQKFSAGEQTKNLVYLIDNSTENNFKGLATSVLHRQSTSRALWGAGLEYNTFSTSNFKFDIYLLSPIVGFTPIRNSLFLVDFFLSLDISFNASLKIKNNSVDEPSAFVIGPQVGARILLFPNQKFHAIATIGYRSYKVYGEDTLTDSSGGNIAGINKINGKNISIGFAMEI